MRSERLAGPVLHSGVWLLSASPVLGAVEL